MGIATFDATSGAEFTWTPLSAGTAQNGDLLVEVTMFGKGERCVTLATERVFARHGYLVRTSFRIAPPGGADPEVTLDAAVSAVRFELPPKSRRAGPLRIARLDDSQWLPMDLGTTGLSLTAEGPVTQLLGAGAYELRDPIAPDRVQRFDVPAPGPVVIDPTLTVVTADRP